MVAPTQVLKLLIVLASLHLLMELVLVGAQLQQILTGLVAVRLKQVLDPIRCVLKANLLFLEGDRFNNYAKASSSWVKLTVCVLHSSFAITEMLVHTVKEIFFVSLQGNLSTGVRFPLRTSKMRTPLQ